MNRLIPPREMFPGLPNGAVLSDDISKGKWIVNVKGKARDKTWEISVLKESNEHGQQSYGWFGPYKLLIGHDGGPCNIPVIPMVWDGLIKLANEVARSLNKNVT